MSIPTPWVFYQDSQRQWHWRYRTMTGKVILESQGTYGSREECMNDARSHGYGYNSKLPIGVKLHKGNFD